METHFPGAPYRTDATGNVYGSMPPKTWRMRLRDWLRSVVAVFTPF